MRVSTLMKNIPSSAKCLFCGSRIIISENKRIIIKNRLMIINIENSNVMIKCRKCGKDNSIV